MSNDTLSVAGVTFTGFSPPSRMGAGGKQAMSVHQLPGGMRVIDTLGPDEDEIAWNGFFFQDNALSICLSLDAIRAAGAVVPLIFCGQFRSVIVSHFAWRVARFPQWVEYRISCTVVTNPGLGALGGGGQTNVSTQVNNDLATAADISQPLSGSAALGTGGIGHA
jgi:hypothetical protein